MRKEEIEIMDIKEKLGLIEECMDLDEGTLKLEDILDEYEEWDSVTALSIIAMVDEQFHRTLSGDALKEAKTVSDIIALME